MSRPPLHRLAAGALPYARLGALAAAHVALAEAWGWAASDFSVYRPLDLTWGTAPALVAFTAHLGGIMVWGVPR